MTPLPSPVRPPAREPCPAVTFPVAKESWLEELLQPTSTTCVRLHYGASVVISNESTCVGIWNEAEHRSAAGGETSQHLVVLTVRNLRRLSAASNGDEF